MQTRHGGAASLVQRPQGYSTHTTPHAVPHLHAGHGKGGLLHIELLVVQLVALGLVQPLLLQHLQRGEGRGARCAPGGGPGEWLGGQAAAAAALEAGTAARASRSSHSLPPPQSTDCKALPRPPRKPKSGGRTRRRTTSARRLAASCAGPGRVFLMMSLCLASCSSSLRIFSSRLQQARGACVSAYRGALGLDRRVDSVPHLSPRVLSLSTASSIVGAGVVGFLPPNSRFMAPRVLLHTNWVGGLRSCFRRDSGCWPGVGEPEMRHNWGLEPRFTGRPAQSNLAEVCRCHSLLFCPLIPVSRCRRTWRRPIGSEAWRGSGHDSVKR